MVSFPTDPSDTLTPIGGKSVVPDGGVGDRRAGSECDASRLRLAGRVGVRTRLRGVGDVDGSSDSLSELVSFDELLGCVSRLTDYFMK